MSNIYKHNGYTFIYKEDMSVEDWLDTRKDGIGGSDVSVVMDVNPWQSAIRLFYEKLNVAEPKYLDENDSIFWGRMDEENIRTVSQYYQKDNPTIYMPNYYQGKQIHTHIDVPFFIINDTIPWLQANVDGFGLNNTLNMEYSEQLKSWIFNGVLPSLDKIIEIKTIKGRSRDRWEGGVPYGYVLQVLTYIAVCSGLNTNGNTIYGEIYSRVDGSNLEYHLIEWDDEIISEILIKTRDFHERVVQAKKELKGFVGSAEEMMNKVMHLEPEPDPTVDYSQFLSEKELIKQASKEKMVAGDDYILDICLKYKEIGNDLKEMEGEKQYLANIMKDWMRKNDTAWVNFSDGRSLKFNKRLYVNV